MRKPASVEISREQFPINVVIETGPDDIAPLLHSRNALCVSPYRTPKRISFDVKKKGGWQTANIIVSQTEAQMKLNKKLLHLYPSGNVWRIRLFDRAAVIDNASRNTSIFETPLALIIARFLRKIYMIFMLFMLLSLMFA